MELTQGIGANSVMECWARRIHGAGEANVAAALNGAAPLLYAYVVAAKIDRVKVKPFRNGYS